MYKKDVINFLFIISFPIYGLGTYFSATSSPSVGYIISIVPHLLILLFYSIDVLHRGEFEFRINSSYFLMLVFVMSSIASLFIALKKGLPESNNTLMLARSLLLIVPFHSFLVTVLYNDKSRGLLKLTLISLSSLLFINLVGFYVLGLSNGVHSIAGRINFPFLDGFYSGASLLAIINLLLLYYLKRAWGSPVSFAALAVYFFFNFLLFFQINSRLTILVFVLVLGLCLLGMIRIRGLYLLSMFTIPILLSSGTIIYKILQLPGLQSMLQRVDVEDVTTFNGRAFLWKDALDWLLNDRQGLVWGNGYKGHYFLGLISDVAKLWNEKDIHHMHLHSTSMEVMVSQGAVFFIVFAVLFYKIYSYYRREHKAEEESGVFFPVVVFLLFIMQVDTFVYLDNLGAVIFSLLVAKIAITDSAPMKEKMMIKNPDEALSHLKVFRIEGVALNYTRLIKLIQKKYDLHRYSRS